MTGKYLLVHLGNISEKYYAEAEQETIHAEHSYFKPIHKLVLIAAIVALTAILVGFTIYTLRLQNMSIGKDTQTQNFNNEGVAVEPTEVEVDVITLYGHSGDPIQQALTEWFAFLETYDPEMKLADNDPDHPEIPNRYEMNYRCYTLDMAKKVDEIAGKYNLKLLDESVLFQQWQSDIFFEETGIDSFLLPDSTAEISHVAGIYYPPYNFKMDFDLSSDVLDSKIFCTVEYTRKDYFPNAHKMGFDLSTFQQWDHTAPDGTPLLLAINNKGVCYIIAEQEDAMMILHITGNLSGSLYPGADEILTKEQLEGIADLFDYSMAPQAADMAVVIQRMEEADNAHWDVPAYEPVKYGSFSECIKSRYTLPNEDLQYTFYDMTGDGVEELLIGRDGGFSLWVTIQDDEVRYKSYISLNYLCEGGVREQYTSYDAIEDRYEYIAPKSNTVVDELDYYDEDKIICLVRIRDQWSSYDANHFDDTLKKITPEEAQEIMNQYPRIKLEWYSFMDYPLSETQTLGEYLEEKDVRVSNEELREIYRKHLLNRKDMHYSHYRIYDINGDGVDDLLLKGEDDSFTGVTDYYWNALTYRYGRVFSFEMDFYLCEDGMLEIVDTRRNLGIGTESNGHQFKRWVGLDEELYELVVYNKAEASWMADWWNEQPLTDEEAEAILAKYPRIDQGMRPISELLG